MTASTRRCIRGSPRSIFGRCGISGSTTTARLPTSSRPWRARGRWPDMPADRPSHHQPAGGIAAVLAHLPRAPRLVRPQSRDLVEGLVEGVVAQLFDAASREPYVTRASGEYRIDDLARLPGATTPQLTG